ncbi:hypothetical protein ACU8KH_00672 [Lachancea thermotolerans]
MLPLRNHRVTSNTFFRCVLFLLPPPQLLFTERCPSSYDVFFLRAARHMHSPHRRPCTRALACMHSRALMHIWLSVIVPLLLGICPEAPRPRGCTSATVRDVQTRPQKNSQLHDRGLGPAELLRSPEQRNCNTTYFEPKFQRRPPRSVVVAALAR